MDAVVYCVLKDIETALKGLGLRCCGPVEDEPDAEPQVSLHVAIVAKWEANVVVFYEAKLQAGLRVLVGLTNDPNEPAVRLIGLDDPEYRTKIVAFVEDEIPRLLVRLTPHPGA